MEFYSHKTYKNHLAQMERYKQTDELRGPYLDWAKSIANIFDRSYPRIGILSLNDLVQEGYVAFLKAWPKLDQELLDKQSDNDKRIAVITNYIKMNVKNGIRRAIASDRDTIRIPENHYNKPDALKTQDIFLTQTFSSFFESHLLDIPDEPYEYEQEKLNEILVDHMQNNLSSVERQIVSMFYGIDEAYDVKKSIKFIANWFGKSEAWVKLIKGEAMKKLKSDDSKAFLGKKLDAAEIYYTADYEKMLVSIEK